jgi:hypothetical protein
MRDPRRELLEFIVKKKIPIRVAIDILEKAEMEIKTKGRQFEKSLLPKYETRAGG